SLEFPTEAEKERKADLNEQKMQVTKQLDLCRHFLPEEYRDDKWKNVKSYILGTTVLCLTSWLSLSFFRAYTREAPQ
ncbi:MAG: hypothetical protein KDK40_03320, partial [Chlamydiia bacterium]|nr:hypothetical protein [Chlamydiia bacterium]